jgi:nucleoside-diphosphate-sugar epimerase
VSAEAYMGFRAVNVEGVANLVKACAGKPLRKFVHFSSTAAMGLIRAEQIDESLPPQPVTPYQRSKYKGEQVVLEACKTHGLPGVILRPCMVYGVGGTGEFAKMCRWMAKGIFPRVGRGPSYTPLVHVRDVARAALRAAERGQPGQTYLVVGESVPIAEMRRIVLDTLHIRRPYPYVPLGLALAGASVVEWLAQLTGTPPPVSRRNILSVATGRVFDVSKAKTELGFEPEIRLADAAREVVAWFKQQAIV